MNKEEWEATRRLGEKIGYGNMMSIASALWRNDLLRQGVRHGAFISTIEEFVREDKLSFVQDDKTVYDSWYKKFYHPQEELLELENGK